jgi:purine-cytosine permease-like protein
VDGGYWCFAWVALEFVLVSYHGYFVINVVSTLLSYCMTAACVYLYLYDMTTTRDYHGYAFNR